MIKFVSVEHDFFHLFDILPCDCREVMMLVFVELFAPSRPLFLVLIFVYMIIKINEELKILH
jgi:hypothetical protein